jgi:hypothetical protein
VFAISLEKQVCSGLLGAGDDTASFDLTGFARKKKLARREHGWLRNDSLPDSFQSHETLKRNYHDKTKNTCEPVVMYCAAIEMRR